MCRSENGVCGIFWLGFGHASIPSLVFWRETSLNFFHQNRVDHQYQESCMIPFGIGLFMRCRLALSCLRFVLTKWRSLIDPVWGFSFKNLFCSSIEKLDLSFVEVIRAILMLRWSKSIEIGFFFQLDFFELSKFVCVCVCGVSLFCSVKLHRHSWEYFIPYLILTEQSSDYEFWEFIWSLCWKMTKLALKEKS